MALVTQEWLERLGPLFRARGEPFPLFVVTDSDVLEALTGFEYHQGVLAVARCPPERPLEDVLRDARASDSRARRLVVALDGVTWADNLGGIMRSAAALGATAVLAGERSASPWLRRAVRISMGGVLFVPVVHTKDLAAELQVLARGGFRIVAADAHAGTRLPDYRFGDDACIVLGHEFEGVSPAVQSVCADAVTIPMTGAIDSLNVASAAAVMMYEFVRQGR
jgi:tRNA G18 (ribose-2'-O)-methylase SpoU